MKRRMIKYGIKRAAAFFLSALFFSALVWGIQDDETPAAKVSILLAKFPAENSMKKNAAAAELLSLGPEGIREVCRRLAPPGADDDSLARFAVDAAAVYAARPGAEAERLTLVKEILRALDEPRDAEVKAFLIRQLQSAGREEIVRPLGRFLDDPKLCGPAARALVAVQTLEAGSVLLKSLGSGSPETALPLIQALGDLRNAAAVKKIMPFAAAQDERLREAALAALANIGDPAAESVFEKIDVTAAPYERTKAASLYLLFARRSFESGRKEPAEKICRDFIKNYTLPGESQIRSSALTLLAKIRGEGIVEVLLEAVDSPDRRYRQRALELADSVSGESVTRRWIEKTERVSPDAQADLVAMLGRRGDKSALPVVREKMKSEDKAVRIAALTAAARLGGDAVMEDVWPLIRSGDEDQVKAAQGVLLSFPSDRVVAHAALLLGEAPPLSRAALIEILAERCAREHTGLVFGLADDENENVRKAALAALEPLARAEDVFRILGLFPASSAAPEIALIQNALVAAANQVADPEKRADEILAALEKTEGSKRADLIRPLARIAGARALAFVVSETKSQDPQAQAVAVYTLANWKDASALEELFKLARGAADNKSRYLALQGIARLTGELSFSPEQKLSCLSDALEIAVEVNEKNLVISRLAGVRTPEALKTAAKFLDDPTFQVKAAQAVVRMVLPAPGMDGLSGLDAAMILKKALLHIENEYDREQAERYARELLFKEGFTALFNGKNLAGWKGLVADPPRRAQMTPEKMRRAQREADELMRRHWKVLDGTLVFDGQGQSLCTLKNYADFEMFVDWKIESKGDGGIYLRGSPQVRIWNPAQGPEGSGGLDNNKINPAKPLVCVDRPVGEWNTFTIRMTGERVTVYLNGVLVVDNVVMENYWERDKPIYPSGQIELQAHTTPLYFRNIYIRES